MAKKTEPKTAEEKAPESPDTPPDASAPEDKTNVTDQAKAKIDDARQAAGGPVEAVRNNPIPAAIAGLFVVLLILGLMFRRS